MLFNDAPLASLGRRLSVPPLFSPALRRDVTLLTFSPAGSDWVDPDDPCAIAETELLGAASSIDAAAKKLASLRPRRAVKVHCRLSEERWLGLL